MLIDKGIRRTKAVGPAAGIDVRPVRTPLPDAHHREAQHASPHGPLDVTAVLPNLLAAPRVPVQDLVATGTKARGGLSERLCTFSDLIGLNRI